MNILFTCAGRRTYLLKYFKEQLNGDGLIIGADMQETAPALTVADVKVKVPSVYAVNYIDVIINICREYNVDLLISLNDLELPILSRNRAKLINMGVTPLVSSPEIIDVCFDKYKTSEFVERIGLKSPDTFVSLDEVKRTLDRKGLVFPLVLKPRWGSGSIGIEFVSNEEELDETYRSLKNKICNTILSHASIGDDVILIQEKIDGIEYGLDVMNDLRGINHGVSVKRKLAMRSGETDKAVTVKNEDIIRIGQTIGKELKHVGNLDVDIFERNGEYYVLELNPRFGGGFPFSYEAGVNFPLAIIQWMKGEAVNDSILIPEYGRAFAKCDYLVEV